MMARLLKIRRGGSTPKKLRVSPILVVQVVLSVVILVYSIVIWKSRNAGREDIDGSIVGGWRRAQKGGLPVIPFVVSMTNCGEDPFMEGAAVLKYSIHKASVHGNMGGRYDYKMVAIHHPDATECAKSLEDLGYELIERPTPVKVEEIQGEFLKERIESNGCCGSKELIKLEAYTLTDYPVVVHLDMDFLLLKPIDTLFDVMLDESSDLSKYTNSLDLMWPNQRMPEKVNAFFTRDFGMVKFNRKYKPVQGGFLVVRPDMAVYNELVGLVKKGDFDKDSGWGGVVGKFYGSMTIQGLLPYYYDVLHPGQSVDLNRCIHDQMADDPRDDRQGKCNTGEDECEDCRVRPVGDLVSVHFTNCLKPWHCVAHQKKDLEHELCQKMHHEWFRVRSDLEETWGHNATGNGTFFPDMFFGFCKRHGKKGYMPISRPFRPSFV